MPRRAPKAKFPWGMFLVGVGGMGALFVYLAYDKTRQKEGKDLWEALGFPYGPTGNLPGIGADYFAGLNRSDGHNAIPIKLLLTTVSQSLTDTTGTVLTDTTGAALTDATSRPVGSLFTSRNAAGLVFTGNYSGSKPS